MTLREASNRWTPRFIETLYPSDPASAQMEIELIFSDILQKDRAWVLVHDETEMAARQLRKFEELAGRRLKHEPMAYVLGHREFYGRVFFTDKRALIPRPETELIVEKALASLSGDSAEALIWDVGTGCGAIAIMMAKKRPLATVLASDIDRSALALARKNASLHQVDITFICDDLLGPSVKKTLKKSPTEDLLVLANLPYLPLTDKETLEPDVVDYEPSGALFTSEDGLFLIHQLLNQLSNFQMKVRMFDRLTVLVEYDPPQTKKLRALAETAFPSAQLTIHQDLCGRDRVLEIHD